MTSLPAFKNGLLPQGVWSCSGDEFIKRFCQKSRSPFAATAIDLFDFATARGAISMFCGGSFVTSKSNPADFDCIVVFATEDQIPDRTERFDIEGTNLDVFFCALDQPKHSQFVCCT